MLTDSLDVVIGVDTHEASHTLCLVSARTGALVGSLALPANRSGYRQALSRARRAGSKRLWALEGTGSYGAGLARFLAGRGERVCEVERPRREGGRGRAKSDPLDALRAARAVIAGAASAAPRACGAREALRVLLTTREGAVAVRRAGLNELRALVVCAPEELREPLRGRSQASLVRACLALRPRADQDPELRATRLALRSCAQRVRSASREAASLEREIALLVEALAPVLLGLHGVGPISAGFVLIAWSHPGRLKSEAAFARLAGAAPIEASSGKHVRHRLDRGGDRRLNRALHTILLCRRRSDPQTRAYIARRLNEGKSTREALRCLKRYLARHLFRLLEGMPVTA